MARPLRIEFPGAFYHIISRGNAQQPIYLNNADKKHFLKILASTIKRFSWLCHAYVMLENHYHLLIETPEANLSRGMRQLNGCYTQQFNRQHQRAGHLFQGRYKAIVVDKENYLLELSRYIVLNPVRAGLVKNPEDWQWSSYRSIIGVDKKHPFLQIEEILSRFSENTREAMKRYRQFVKEGLRKDYPNKAVKGQIILGKEKFIKIVKQHLQETKNELKEIPRSQRYATRPELHEIFRVKHKGKKKRDDDIYRAYVEYGYTMKEIGDYIGVHYTAVSRALQRIEKKR